MATECNAGDVPLVSVISAVYNQKDFVRDTIEGFLKQKTTFPIEIVIHDDHSTDGTTEILEEYKEKYPNLITLLLETENQYSKGVPLVDILVTNMLPHVRGKYLSGCAGDDYWTDEYKLQKEADFLEKNTDYAMCYTKARYYSVNKKKFVKVEGKDFGESLVWEGNERKSEFDYLIKYGNKIPAMTTMYRKDLTYRYFREIEPQKKGWLMEDYPMWLYFSSASRLKFFDECTAVYRIIDGSLSHQANFEKYLKFRASASEIAEYFKERCQNDNITHEKFDIVKDTYSIIQDYIDVYGLKKDAAKKLQCQYKLLREPVARNDKLTYIASHSFILWYALSLIRNIKKKITHRKFNGR